MMTTNRQFGKNSKSKNALIVVIACLIVFPLSLNGHSHKRIDKLSGKMSNVNQNKGTITVPNMAKDGKINFDISPNALVTAHLVAISISLLIIATFLLSLITAFLNHVPIAKQSIILYLYKDITLCVLLYCYLTSITLCDCFFYGDGSKMNETHAKLSSYFIIYVSFHAMYAMNAAMILKLYARRENVIDPMPTLMENEELVIKVLRGSGFVLINLSLIIVYIVEWYPLFYYLLIGDPRIISDLPMENKVLAGVFIMLSIFTACMGMLSKIYKNHDIVNFNTLSVSLSIVGDLVIIPLLLVLTVCIGLSTVFLDFTGNEEVWIGLIILQIIFGTIAPLITIAKSSDLQTYTTKRLKELRTRLISIWRATTAFFRRTRRIQPIE